MSNSITNKKYAKWLEEVLRDICDLPIKSIALVGTLENGDAYTSYYEASMVDKLALSGLINQDATMDMLAANGVVSDENEEEDNEDPNETDDDFLEE